MSYHIEINEYQRRLIMKALTSTDVNQFSQAPGSGDAFDTEAKEFVCLWYRCLVRSTSTRRDAELESTTQRHVGASIYHGAGAVRLNHPRRDLVRSIGVCPASPPTP
jgi:hypothetical protein